MPAQRAKQIVGLWEEERGQGLAVDRFVCGGQVGEERARFAVQLAAAVARGGVFGGEIEIEWSKYKETGKRFGHDDTIITRLVARE
jgi:hypothetical protein